jgi:hypothetical protein
MIDEKNIKLEYRKKFREDFTAYYVEIIYDKENNKFERIYFYDYMNGTIKYEKDIKEVHRWEDEDEAQFGSYLNRRYTTILLNGIVDDPVIEDKIIGSNYEFIKTINIKENELEILNKAIKYIKNNRSPSMAND